MLTREHLKGTPTIALLSSMYLNTIRETDGRKGIAATGKKPPNHIRIHDRLFESGDANMLVEYLSRYRCFQAALDDSSTESQPILQFGYCLDADLRLSNEKAHSFEVAINGLLGRIGQRSPGLFWQREGPSMLHTHDEAASYPKGCKRLGTPSQVVLT